MEPRIQYAKTSDGVSIAFATLGDGIPLVCMPNHPWSHIQLEWQWPEYRRWLERLAEKRMVVLYDGRGTGLSDRDVLDQSLDSLLLDVQAVADRLALKTFAVLATGTVGPVAITYTAHHPDRVSHVLLWASWARAQDAWRSPQYQAFRALRDLDWKTYTETLAHAMVGWSEDAKGSQMAAFFRECVTQEVAQAAYSAIQGFDATDLLSQVRTPTLVLHRREAPILDVSLARDLASRIPDARLAVLEGTSGLPWEGDTDAVLSAIEEFLGEGEEETATPLAKEDVHTILFTDVEGSTALTQRLGDAKAREVMREHERMVREALKSHGGSELKTTGDGFMASFSSATKALESAIAMQRAFAQRNESAEEPILVRVGMNAGEPIAEEEDLFGTAVIRAARIAAEAKGGEILVANVVRELAEGKQFLFADRGEVALKGFDEPVRLYEVRWQE